jgi:hypothetical protein
LGRGRLRHGRKPQGGQQQKGEKTFHPAILPLIRDQMSGGRRQ